MIEINKYILNTQILNKFIMVKSSVFERLNRLYSRIPNIKLKKMTYRDLLENLVPESSFNDSNQEVEDSPSPEKTEYIYQRANTPIIYAFVTPQVPNAIKVGYTDQGVFKRIDQWKAKYEDVNLVGYWTSREFDKAGQYVFFKDWPVHEKIIKKGYSRLPSEAFRVDDLKTLHVSREFFNKISDTESQELSDTVLKAILDGMKEEIRNGTALFGTYKLNQDGTVNGEKADSVIHKVNAYDPTPLQTLAIEKGVNAIKEGKKDLLMAAVMRFGKTFTTYEIVKQSGLRKVLVCSAKVDVRDAWWNDISHRDFIDDFVFIDFEGINVRVSEKNDRDGLIHRTLYSQTSNIIEYKSGEGKTVIVFVSLQDLSGSNQEVKEKHKYLYETEFDLVVVDETHYGSHGQSQGQAIGLRQEDKNLEQFSNKIKKDITLQCSGTPYYILASGEFASEYENKEIISDVSYTDMLEARDKWVEDHPGEDESKSPYYGIPNICKFGMQLTPECQKAIDKSDVSEKMSSLFRIDERTDRFANESAIRQLVEYIYGDPKKSKVGFLDVNKVKEGEIFKHTIIVLPRIKACNRMRDLLKSMDLDGREVICAVNENNWYEESAKDPNSLRQKLEDLEKSGKRSIILTVNRFLTGTSLPLVDSMMFMKDTRSPQEYDQAIFRLCTRNIGTATDKDGNEVKINRKANVFLLDFNISRMFEMVIQSSIAQAKAKEGSDINDIEKLIEDNLKSIPVYANSVYNTNSSEIVSKMHAISPKDLMREYIKYNKDRSIGKSVDENIGMFDFVRDINNLDLVSKFKGGMNSMNSEIKNMMNDRGQDTIDTTFMSMKQEKDIRGTKDKTKEDISNERILRDGFSTCIKNILYCNLVFDNPVSSFKEFIESARGQESQKVQDFNLNVDLLDSISNRMSAGDLSVLDMMLYRVAYQSRDNNIENEVDRFKKAIEDLGKIDKSEVVTPQPVVEKMISKIDEEEYRRAGKILLVNEKCGEFLGAIYSKFGKDVTDKCKIIPSSNMTKCFIEKIVKSLGLNDDIILNISDTNNDNKLYDDFLNMPNEDIEKMNGGKKFDICLMNPPYDKALHLDFLDKAIDVSEKTVIVEPGQWLVQLKDNGKYTKKDCLAEQIKKKIQGHVRSVELSNLNRAFNITNKTVCSVTCIDYANNYDKIDLNVCGEQKQVGSIYDCNLVGDYKLVKSILNKCLAYKDHMINHCIDTKKYKEYEGKGYWFLRYANYMINNLGKIADRNWKHESIHIKTKVLDSLDSYFAVLAGRNEKDLSQSVYISKSGAPSDSVYGTKEELENWRWFAYNNKLPIFINVCLTIDENNNSRCYVPWIVDKRHTDEEIYKMLGISSEEQKLIDETIKKFDKDSEFGKQLFNI